MSVLLPDELWRRILEIGIRDSGFDYKDLCCISISCRRFHRLSVDDSLWSHLFSSDFPNQISNCNNIKDSSSSSSFKSLYRIRFEREKERRLLAHRRAVMRKESQVLEFSRKIRELEGQLRGETDKLRATAVELSNLHKVRQASVALNVWQPEIVRGRQKEIVEQCAVSVESRQHALEMELKLCKQRIGGFEKSYKAEKRRLKSAEEELASMKYHPLRDYGLTSRGDNECNTKRKKLKRWQ
ncbi:F-box protein SKIP24 [Tripterygium wilfordii]|uniref:F-box protein SKIP24 n=1 Tax=Tripterygium wilfordii TaxID=458696 RepID=A0A7J7DS75_TRIWF|nr:F-box protein SKIP24 [Tripterygium wilfordii]KAF5749143.1 F-box protein SKIP24 [Tripterygium wilfordii]